MLKRIEYITRLLREAGFEDIRLKRLELETDPSSGYFIIEACRGAYKISIYERFVHGALRKYSYVLLREDTRILGYNNAPHHPHVRTHPHHKHVQDRVEPLENPSVEAFIEEVRRLLLQEESQA